jgi:hypothetical protein
MQGFSSRAGGCCLPGSDVVLLPLPPHADSRPGSGHGRISTTGFGTQVYRLSLEGAVSCHGF